MKEYCVRVTSILIRKINRFTLEFCFEAKFISKICAAASGGME